MPEKRVAGLRGRLPVKPVGHRFAIQYLSSYLSTALPAPRYPVDVYAGITTWGMLGNGPDPTCTTHPNGVGDCTFAGRQHLEMAKAAAGHESQAWETSDALVAEYLAYDHGKDQGANIADLLLYWYDAQKILAFAPVDHTNPAAVDSAMAAFHGAYAGVNLTSDAESLFSAGQPWTTSGGQRPDPTAGHCILKVAADGTQFDTWVTWGASQQSTLGWTSACLEEAWVIITGQDADAANLDIAALRADINALRGTGGS
ncbi:MAG TPA: hypothetical protein VG253_11360 [Streptosporangiaceae bacterium]|nr:hypothetical protein [Streptosporangiaceae bacterium]